MLSRAITIVLISLLLAPLAGAQDQPGRTPDPASAAADSSPPGSASAAGVMPSGVESSQPSPGVSDRGASPTAPAHISITEMHLTYGRLEVPTFAGRKRAGTGILTFQHFSTWDYGSNFFFVDFLKDDHIDGFNDYDAYMEYYGNFSFSKITGIKIEAGPLADVGFLAGLNYDADFNYLKLLPGVRLAWNLPGFTFFNTDISAFLDASGGLRSHGAPANGTAMQIDFNWSYPFSIGRHDFCVEGHVEFISARRDELGRRVEWWVLAQPQFRYDLGKTLFNRPKQLFAGIEWQVWINKFGDRDTQENAAQALLVWRF